MNALDNGDLSPEQASRIADALDVPVHDVVTMNLRMAAPDQSLNTPVYDDGVDQWQDHMPDKSESYETVLADREEFAMRKAQVAKGFLVLNRRERRIVTERWLRDDPSTLEELAGELQRLARTDPTDRSACPGQAA